jgi:hypothetical protein
MIWGYPGRTSIRPGLAIRRSLSAPVSANVELDALREGKIAAEIDGAGDPADVGGKNAQQHHRWIKRDEQGASEANAGNGRIIEHGAR